MFNFIRQNFLVAFSYIGLSLLIGEYHPFTLAGMYDSFPPTACTFYLTDANGNLQPLAQHYRYTTSNLTHYYHALCQQQNINEPATPAQLHQIGEGIMKELQHHQLTAPTGNLQLHRITYFLKNDSLQSSRVIMYETGSR